MVLHSNLLCIMSFTGVDVHPGENAILDAVAVKIKKQPAFNDQIKAGNFNIIEDVTANADGKAETKPSGNIDLDEAMAIIESKESAAIACIKTNFNPKVLSIVAERAKSDKVKSAAAKQLAEAEKTHKKDEKGTDK